MTAARIRRLQNSGPSCTIARTGPLVQYCEDCGADLSQYQIHRVWTAQEVAEELGIADKMENNKQPRKNTKDRLRDKQAKLEQAGQKRLL